MENLLRACVIGAGDMGIRHLKAWQNIPECQVVSLVEGVPQRLEEAGKENGISALYTDYKAAILETKPDVVSVCLPTAFHAPVTIFALENGAHVLCEKPISLSVEEAQSMQQKAQETGKLLAIGFMLRYSPAVAKLKQWITEGRIGHPVMVTSENFMEVRPKVVMHAKNINGGPVVDYWCHHFDLWEYLFESQPESIAGYGATLASGKAEVAHINELAIDTAAISLKFRSGDIAQFSTTWGLPTSLKPYSIVGGDKFFGPNGIIFGDVRGKLTLVQADGYTEEVSNSGINWWQVEIEHFARAIREGSTYIGADNGLQALRVSLAALQAIESGQTVTL